MRPWLAALWVAGSLAGCHLALGLEEAEELESAGEDCGDDADCGDQNPCTTDRCEAGTCLHDPLEGDAPDSAQNDGDCRRLVCTEGAVADTTDTTDVPIDGKECTEDLCSGNQPENPPRSAGSLCTEDGGAVCDGAGQCVECASNAQCAAPQTCGGGGPPGECGCTPTITCATVGLTCGGGGMDDCGMALQCSNGVQDGDETDVDCGGPQPSMGGTCAILCQNGKACLQNNDCVSGTCDSQICAP